MKFKLLVIHIGLALSSSVLAEGIATDGTMGAAQTLSGATVSISQSLGSTVGNNLFHSFSDFNINTGQTVTFVGADNLQNVISRVTGDNKSIIDGTLKSEIKNADFYFINPNGITFNANSSVDVPAAFHVSTADKIDFGKNRTVFYSNLDKKSTLSSESPVSLGFLGTSQTNNGLLYIDHSQLSFKGDSVVDVVAGNITMKGDGNDSLIPNIQTTSGQFRAIAIQNDGEIDLKNLAVQLPLKNGGNILFDNVGIDLSGNKGGNLFIQGNSLNMNGGYVFIDNTGYDNPTLLNGIDIATNEFIMQGESYLTFDVMGEGNAGNININAESMNVLNGAEIHSNTNSKGNAGNLVIVSNILSVNNKSSENYTSISSDAYSGSSGNAGLISINTNSVNLLNGGEIHTNTWASGNAGTITINANELTADGQNSAFFTGVSSSSELYDKNNPLMESGDAGNVNVNGTLNLFNGGVIRSDTFTIGNGKEVFVKADNIIIDGRNSKFATGVTSNANSNSNGNAGAIKIDAKNILIQNEGGISSRTNIQANGNSGYVNIKAEQIDLKKGGYISTSTNSVGSAGDISLTTNKLAIDSKDSATGTGIYSSSWTEDSSGKTGVINIASKDNISLINKAEINIQNEAVNLLDKSSGAIKIETKQLDMIDSNITTESKGGVPAGEVRVDVLKNIKMQNSFINSTANKGDGGEIVVNSNELISLKNSGFKTTVNGEDSNGGDISVKAEMLVMDTGLIQANAVSGNGGNINLALQALIPSENSLIKGGESIDWDKSPSNIIQAASQSGVSGTVNNSAPQMNLSGVLANIGNNNFENRLVSQDYCATNKGSSLSKKGKGGLPLRSLSLRDKGL